jgi:hypothetical protein
MESTKRARTAAHLERLGIDGSTFAPPPYRVAWWLGLDIAPPLFTRFVWSAIAQSIFYALAIGVVLWALDALGVFAGALNVVVVGSLLCGLALGITEAVRYRFIAKRYGLPRWERYDPPVAA